MNRRSHCKGGKNMQTKKRRRSSLPAPYGKLRGKHFNSTSEAAAFARANARRSIQNDKIASQFPSTDIMKLSGIFGEDHSGKSFDDIREEAKEKHYNWRHMGGKL